MYNISMLFTWYIRVDRRSFVRLDRIFAWRLWRLGVLGLGVRASAEASPLTLLSIGCRRGRLAGCT